MLIRVLLPVLLAVVSAIVLQSALDWSVQADPWVGRTAASSPPRKVAVLGASGATGHELLRNLVKAATDKHNPISSIVLLVRSFGSLKQCRQFPPHMKKPPSFELFDCVAVDFGALASAADDTAPSRAALAEKLRGVDVLFSAFGTTRALAGSDGAFRRVDHDYVLAVAAAARQARVPHLSVVTSTGADPRASSLYLRTKGEVEASLRTLLGPAGMRLSIFRPSLLLTGTVHQRADTRLGEDLSKMVLAPLAQWLPPNLKPVSAYFLAQSMLVSAGWAAASGESGAAAVDVFENSGIHAIGNNFFQDFGGSTAKYAGGACGWGCAGAIDDHDNGEAQREVSKLALSADRTQGKK
jgi:hypothetical protein